MTVSTYDNAPPVAGWTPQPGRHCSVCGEYLPQPLIELGEN